MALVLLGVALVLMHALEIGPPADWSWWVLLAPFGLAVLWWAWADSSGRTRRQQDDKYEKIKSRRRQRAIDSMSMRGRRK